MIRAWVDLVRNRELIDALYTEVPPLGPVTLRSVHLDRRGPTLTLRCDLPAFPDRPLPEWAGHDRLQVLVQFLAVDEVLLEDWRPAAVVRMDFEPLERRRVRVSATGDVRLGFTSSDSLTVGHVSAFHGAPGAVDDGPHAFAGKVDRMRFTTVPDAWQKGFHERV